MRAQFPPARLLPQATCALRDHMRVRPGEKLAILWDETVSRSLFEAIRMAAQELEAESTTLTFAPLAYRPIQEYGLFAGRSLQAPLRLPVILKQALLAADCFLLLCSDTELLFSEDLKEVLRAGKRGLFLPYMDSFNAERMLFTTSQEVEAQARLVDAVGECFEGATEAHVTSKEGTDLRLKLGQWNTLRRKGLPRPGELMFLPAGNVARNPDEGSANGTLVIDRTICANDYKELHEPIIFTIEGGYVSWIEGGMEAKLLAEFLKSLNDPRAYHLTELAVGTNPRCKWSGIGAPSEDTHVLGTVAFALGCDTHIGGGTPGPVHIDMTMRFPTLMIGERTIVQDGRLMVGAD